MAFQKTGAPERHVVVDDEPELEETEDVEEEVEEEEEDAAGEE